MKIPFLLIATALLVLWAPHEIYAAGITPGKALAPFSPQIKPGEYVWAPELSPSGPVIVIVNLQEQLLFVYRNGMRIGRSSISSGKSGYATPTGVFTILEKEVEHTSTIYDASMPYMERLTWGGVALHAGNLPGYPAAHGCVRLPLEFAKKLYKVTSRGTTVIVADRVATTDGTTSPGLLFDKAYGANMRPGPISWHPESSQKGAVTIIVSSADKAAYVYRDGAEIGHSLVAKLPRIKGTYVYSALNQVDATGRRNWLATTVKDKRPPDIKKLVDKSHIDPQFLANVRALVVPGTTLILTSEPVGVSTRSDRGFNILTAVVK